MQVRQDLQDGQDFYWSLLFPEKKVVTQSGYAGGEYLRSFLDVIQLIVSDTVTVHSQCSTMKWLERFSSPTATKRFIL